MSDSEAHVSLMLVLHNKWCPLLDKSYHIIFSIMSPFWVKLLLCNSCTSATIFVGDEYRSYLGHDSVCNRLLLLTYLLTSIGLISTYYVCVPFHLSNTQVTLVFFSHFQIYILMLIKHTHAHASD